MMNPSRFASSPVLPRPLCRVPSLWLGAAAVALGVGCSKEPEQRPPQVGQYLPASAGQPGYAQGYGGQPGYASSGTAGAPAPAAAGAPAGPLGPILSDPNALQNLLAGALSGGAAALGAVTGGELGPIQQGIKAKAAAVAKGMKAEGELMSAKLQQGGHAEGTVTLQPGSCYTVVGFGGLGVFDDQVNLITAPPMPPQVLAQSLAGGIEPVIGALPDCIKNPSLVPLPVKVDLHVIRGQGMVGAQVYRQ